MKKEAIVTDRIAKPVGPFSPAVRAGGSIYMSGQVAQDPATGKLVAGDVTRQTEQVFRNVRVVLEAAGKSLSDVVAVRVYLTDMANFAAMNEVYAKQFEQPYPARTTIGVKALPLGAEVEIDLIAQ
jgi:2-iminobutanoate/2-iminopropanoate deaminase